MAKVIDARAGGGEIVLLGTSLVLPIDDQAASVREPMNGSMRYNPTTDALEAFVDVAGTFEWCAVAIERGDNAFVRSSGSQMSGTLTMSGAQILLDRGSIQAPGLAFVAQSATGLGLDVNGDLYVSLAGSLAANFQANGVHTSAVHTANAIHVPGALIRGQDLSELYEADAAYSVGTVVTIGGPYEVTASTTYADVRVAGIVTGGTGGVLNSSKTASSGSLIAIAAKGRVLCNVIGPVARGDLLCTSATLGYAQSYGQSTLPESAILGRALQSMPGTGTGAIMIKV